MNEKVNINIFSLGLSVFFKWSRNRTSENNERLKGWLKKFPEADKNKDGVLTGAEALEFIRSKKGGNPNRKKTHAKSKDGFWRKCSGR